MYFIHHINSFSQRSSESKYSFYSAIEIVIGNKLVPTLMNWQKNPKVLSELISNRWWLCIRRRSTSPLANIQSTYIGIYQERERPGKGVEIVVKTKITVIHDRIVILMSDRKFRGFGKLLSRSAIPSRHVSIPGCYVIVQHRHPPGGGVIGLGHVQLLQYHNQYRQENHQNCHIAMIVD